MSAFILKGPEVLESVNLISRKKGCTVELVTTRKNAITDTLVIILTKLPPKLYSHCVHVSVIANILAKQAAHLPKGTSMDTFAHSVRLGGLYHHFGYQTPSKKHMPIAGEHILRAHPPANCSLDWDTVLDIARHHCERMDGSGYPDKLAGEEISLAARLTGFSDALDTLLTKSSGSTEQNVSKATQYMEKNGNKLFGIDVMDCFKHTQTYLFDLYLKEANRTNG